METNVNILAETTNYEFANLNELLAATNPQTGNYVIQLYGNIFIHQKPSIDSTNVNNAKITAYQTDKKGMLHFIDNIYVGQYVSQLSVSSNGRYFGFITIKDGQTTGYVYYLDVLAREMDIAHSWSYTNSPNPALFFSVNGQFAIFSPGVNKLQIQSLYSDEPEVVFETPTDNCNRTQMPSNPISVALGNDYLVWLQSNSKLSVIDLVSDKQPVQWPETNIWLPANYDSCVFYNNYLVYTHQPDSQSLSVITILGINNISMTVSIIKQLKFPELGATWCVPNEDGKSVMLHNFHKHRETIMATLLPEITTHFHDYVKG